MGNSNIYDDDDFEVIDLDASTLGQTVMKDKEDEDAEPSIIENDDEEVIETVVTSIDDEDDEDDEDDGDEEDEETPAEKVKKVIKRVLIAILIILLSLLLFLVASEIVTAVDPNGPWAVRYKAMKEFIFGKDEGTVSIGGQTENGLILDPNATDAPKPNDGSFGLSDRSVFFSGIDNAVVNNSSVVYLDNPEENIDFYMQYKIYENDVEIYSTDLIAPGQYVTWEIGGQFSVGEHTLLFTEIPYYQISDDEWMQLTTGVNEVVFTVIE